MVGRVKLKERRRLPALVWLEERKKIKNSDEEEMATEEILPHTTSFSSLFEKLTRSFNRVLALFRAVDHHLFLYFMAPPLHLPLSPGMIIGYVSHSPRPLFFAHPSTSNKNKNTHTLTPQSFEWTLALNKGLGVPLLFHPRCTTIFLPSFSLVLFEPVPLVGTSFNGYRTHPQAKADSTLSTGQKRDLPIAIPLFEIQFGSASL